MLPALEIIPDRRKKLGLTQSQLAIMAGVSQSYIAKLEAKKIEPSYIKVKAIFETLDKIEHKKEVSAAQIMNKGVIGVQASANVNEAIEIMRNHGYSQLPVLQGEKLVGGLSEKIVLEKILNPSEEKKPSKIKVKEIMEETYPQLAEDAPLSLLSNLLKFYPAVLVQKKGEIIGIVTKADLLGILS
jgi:predicted transcriptional regulator